MSRISHFDEDQKRLLHSIIGDMGGPNQVPYLLTVIEELVETLAPGWETELQAEKPQLHRDVEVCMAAVDWMDANGARD